MVKPRNMKGVFRYGGHLVHGWQTPAYWNMKDGDLVSFCSELKANRQLLTLMVNDPRGLQVFRTIRSTDMLQDLMDFYFTTVGSKDGRFLHDGQRVEGWQTPMDLQMEDGDEIDFSVSVGCSGDCGLITQKWLTMVRPIQSSSNLVLNKVDFSLQNIPVSVH